MLSYRHSYHAGNHADILKHLTLLALLKKLCDKDKPFTYIDTHSGCGLYDLQSDEARKTGEAEQGAGRIWQLNSADAGVTDYLILLKALNPGSRLRRYPGSPALAQGNLREQDRMLLMELHNNEIEILRGNFQHDKRISVHHRDGFEGVLALTPPTPRRGMVLIDPAYEVRSDYEKVLTTCEKLHKRWAQGILAIWYPLLGRQRDRSVWLKDKFEQKKFTSLLCLELRVQEQSEDAGMHGSGMLLVNAPWQLDLQMRDSLLEVARLLGAGCTSRVDWLTENK